MILYRRDPKDSIGKLLEWINIFDQPIKNQQLFYTPMTNILREKSWGKSPPQ